MGKSVSLNRFTLCDAIQSEQSLFSNQIINLIKFWSLCDAIQSDQFISKSSSGLSIQQVVKFMLLLNIQLRKFRHNFAHFQS